MVCRIVSNLVLPPVAVSYTHLDVYKRQVVVKGPDEKLQLVVSASPAEKPSYSITYNGKTMLEKSPLGMNTNIGDFVKGMKLTGHAVTPVSYTHLDVYKRQDPARAEKRHTTGYSCGSNGTC